MSPDCLPTAAGLMLGSDRRPPGNAIPLQCCRLWHTPPVVVATAARCRGAAVQKKEPPGQPGGRSSTRNLIMAHPETQKPAPCVPVSTACAQCPNPGPDSDLSDATGSEALKIRPVLDRLVKDAESFIEFYYRERRSLELLEAGTDAAEAMPTQAELIHLLVKYHGWVVVRPGTMVRAWRPF